MQKLFLVSLLLSFVVFGVARPIHHASLQKTAPHPHDAPHTKPQLVVPTNHHHDEQKPQQLSTQHMLRNAPKNIIQYKGCFVDAETRTLPFTGSDYVDFTNGMEKLSFESCYSMCFNTGYQYLGLQYGSQCYCGMDLPQLGSGTCNMPCSFNNSMTCGGTWANSVYFLGSNPRYLGCFVDTPSRVFPLAAGAPNEDWSPTSCMHWCAQAGYTLAGLEDGGQCFCGDEIFSAPATNCNVQCSSVSDNPNSMCGGVWALSVYYSALRRSSCPAGYNCPTTPYAYV